MRLPSRMSVAARPIPTLVLLSAVALALAASFAAPSGAARGPTDEPADARPRAGQPLAEALQQLRAHGLDLFFTSNVVRPDMSVLETPEPGTPRQVLDHLLAPHGLEAVAGPGGRLVVVAATAAPGLHGLVRGRLGEVPIPGALVLVQGTGLETRTGDDGTFHLADVPVGTWTLEVRLPGFVVERRQVTVAAGRGTEVVVELEAAPLTADEIVVTPSRVTLLREDPAPGFDLDRDQIFALPHLGDDIFRALTLLPGVTGEETSARFHVRGGRSDEVLVLLDGVELYEPYHLEDYGGSLSIVAPRALREVQLITGGFPARYGDRMSGVLDMSTVEPRTRSTHVGLGTMSLELGGTGAFDDGRGQWLASARRDSLDLTLDFLDRNEKPRYWDASAKVAYQLTPSQRLTAHGLHSDDSLDYFNLDPDTEEDYLTGYGNSYAWLGHQQLLGPRLYVDTTAYAGRVDRDRRGREKDLESDEEGAGFTLVDRRRLDVAGVKQEWRWQTSTRHDLGWGFEARRLVAEYDYFNDRVLDDPLEDVRSEPRTGTTELRRRLEGEQVNLYVSDRLRATDALTLELGLRYDEHTLTDDRDLSPRVNLVWALDPGDRGASVLRLAWGYFYQGQRPYELQVEDGITELASAERTEQRLIGFERTFATGGRSPVLLRLEAYQRRITDPRPRYENLFEPISIYPEIEPDRVLIAPERSEGWGVELFLRGSAGERVEWWGSYIYSEIEDHLDGRRVPRRIDQPHAVNLDLDLRLGTAWRLNLAWRYHTGWPTTSITGELEVDDEGEVEVVPVLGPLNAERLGDYHRLDLRASREWQLRRGVLGVYLEVQNVYDRFNVAGFDVDLEARPRPDGSLDVVALEEVWGGRLTSFGITWDF